MISGTLYVIYLVSARQLLRHAAKVTTVWYDVLLAWSTLKFRQKTLTVSSPAVIFIDLLKFQFCWDVILHCWLCSSQRFEALQGLHLQGPAVHNPWKCWEPLIWHSITSMKTWTLGSTAVRILNLITHYGCSLLYIIAFEVYSELKRSTEYGWKVSS